jgi:hypothetical protein
LYLVTRGDFGVSCEWKKTDKEQIQERGCPVTLRFEWDERKATSNLRKYHVSFDEASTVFQDPLARIFDDEPHTQPRSLGK